MRRALLLLVVVAACDYPRPPPVGGDDDDVDAATDAAMIDGDDTDAPAVDAPPNDGILPIDARVDAVPIDGPPIDAPGTISVAMTPPSTSTTLGTTTRFTVSITSNGFAGTVNLASSGGPADWTRTLPSTVNLTLGQTQMVNLDVTIATNDSAATGGANLTVSGTITGQSPVSDTSTLTVADEYIVPIAAGTGTGQHWVGQPTVTMRVGSRFTIQNDDAAPHQIHAASTIPGVIHQSGLMTTGASYSVVIGGTGTDTIYCHAHGQAAGQFTLVAQ
jgi:hypothetical protein